jgi:hypothetical protein
MEEELAKIGKEMLESNNQATSFPVWVTENGRAFLSQTAAHTYYEMTDIPYRVWSAHDNPQMQILMTVCLENAIASNPELANHAQLNNAYFGLI